MSAQNIVIIGGGIIGCTTAYYLSHHPSVPSSTSITIIEASVHGVAQGASGKAGGLVAKWAYPKELVDISFQEHVRLAIEHDGQTRWGWRYVDCGNWEGRGDDLNVEIGSGVGLGGERKSLEKTLGLADRFSGRASKGLPDNLTWVKEELTDSYSPMAPFGDTAQLHPYQFTSAMLELAQEKGVNLISGKATSIKTVGGKVCGVTYLENEDKAETTVPATQVISCAGAWSPVLIPAIPISATRAHSITIKPLEPSSIAPYVLFTEIKPSAMAGKKAATPEIYAPVDEVYACGPGDDSRLPVTVDEVQVDDTACKSIHDQVASISQQLREGTVDKRQACFLPIVETGGGPIIGEAVRVAKGLFVATGHTCWGICNAPGTAKAIAELVLDGKVSCANLKKLEPSKFF